MLLQPRHHSASDHELRLGDGLVVCCTCIEMACSKFCQCAGRPCSTLSHPMHAPAMAQLFCAHASAAAPMRQLQQLPHIKSVCGCGTTSCPMHPPWLPLDPTVATMRTIVGTMGWPPPLPAAAYDVPRATTGASYSNAQQQFSVGARLWVCLRGQDLPWTCCKLCKLCPDCTGTTPQPLHEPPIYTKCNT
jgi:hypothetical protein